MMREGFPHSDISDSCACTRLAGAFRSVPRPSSALDAKASPVCPCLLYPSHTEKRILSHFAYSRLMRLACPACVYVVVKLLRSFPRRPFVSSSACARSPLDLPTKQPGFAGLHTRLPVDCFVLACLSRRSRFFQALCLPSAYP